MQGADFFQVARAYTYMHSVTSYIVYTLLCIEPIAPLHRTPRHSHETIDFAALRYTVQTPVQTQVIHKNPAP